MRLAGILAGAVLALAATATRADLVADEPRPANVQVQHTDQGPVYADASGKVAPIEETPDDVAKVSAPPLPRQQRIEILSHERPGKIRLFAGRRNRVDQACCCGRCD